MPSPVSSIKSTGSVVLLMFSLLLIHALIFDKQTSFAAEFHPAVAFFSLWVGLLWLSMVEGGQASMVGLPPIDRSLYQESHPITFAICEWGHEGDNLNRYLMGRQFMVLAFVFLINNAGAPIDHADVLNLPTWVSQIFLESGLAMILATCMIGQLNTQINASHCMLDYINTRFMTVTLYVALGIEASGVLHTSYLIQYLLGVISGKPTESKEPPRTPSANAVFWAKVVFSTLLLMGSIFITFVALFEGKTTMWEGIPSIISMIMTLLLWSFVGMLEGMQIAFFSVSKLREEERNSSPWAKKTCEILFDSKGHNLPGFMVGRQLCVVAAFFVAARATTMDINDGEENVLGVPNAVQAFFDTGLLGAFTTTIVASIAWQHLARAFPMEFLSNPITYSLLRICLLLESTGVCEGAWVLAEIHKSFAKFEYDEVYVGTAEEREAEREYEDEELVIKSGRLAPQIPISAYKNIYTTHELDKLERELDQQQAKLNERRRALEIRRDAIGGSSS